MKNKVIYLLLLAFITISLAGCNDSKSRTIVSDKKNIDISTGLEKDIDDYCKDHNFRGSMLIVDNGKTLIKKGYGMADYNKAIPNKPNTIFRLGSITKQFTATCILMLQERGLLNVTDPISKYIPDYPNGNKITLHNLLTHSSGIAEHTTPDFFSHADHYYSPIDIINLFKDKPTEFEPGAEFKYSNSNYILLGYVIEKVSNEKYESFVNKNIFIPLGMKCSGYDHNETTPDKAVGYDYIEKNLIQEAQYIDMSTPYSAGALQTNVEDLYKWDQALYTEKLLKKDTITKMFTPYKSNYAYGWMVNSANTMEHGGGVNGFRTYIYRDTEKKRFIAILSNCTEANVAGLKNEIVSLF